MPAGVIIPHGVATGIQVAVVVKQIAWIRHEGIGREELAQFGVVVAGVVVLQAAPSGHPVAFLAGELVVGDDGAGIALAAIGIVLLVGGHGAGATGF